MKLMTNEEKLDYVLSLFKANKMDMEITTIKGLIPEFLQPDLIKVLSQLVEYGYLQYSNNWWSATTEGRYFDGFKNATFA